MLAGRVLQNLRQRLALHPSDVVLILEKGAKRIADHLRRQGAGVEFCQRCGPVDRLGSTGGPATSNSSACSKGRLIRYFSAKISLESCSRSVSPAASARRMAIICAALFHS